jgi:predicted ATPase
LRKIAFTHDHHTKDEFMPFSEIRTSSKTKLLEKVRKNDYGKYLFKASLVKIRGFLGEDITFNFPVTALIGPNGSGKSSVLGAAGCAYKLGGFKSEVQHPVVNERGLSAGGC